MQTLLYLEINLFSIAILTVIFFYIYNRIGYYKTEYKLFLSILGLGIFLLVLDSAMWLLDAKSGLFLHNIYLTVTALYYILNPVISMVWTYYADYEIYCDNRRLKKMRIPFLIPVIINTAFSLFSMFGNYSFTIDQNNIYHRGRFFWVMATAGYVYLVYTILLILLNRKNVSRKRFHALLGFVLPPFVAGILQSLFYGLSLVWICSTLSIFIIFLNLNNDQLNTDHLTGLYNRRQVDYYLKEKMKYVKSKMVIGIMLDIDSFKKINDQYGHSAGDQALEFTADILKESCDKNDFIARYGGDEFLIISEIDHPSNMSSVIAEIHNNLEHFNERKIVPYTLSLSMGYDIFDCYSKDAIKEFLVRIDRLMYENKRSMKHI